MLLIFFLQKKMVCFSVSCSLRIVCVSCFFSAVLNIVKVEPIYNKKKKIPPTKKKQRIYFSACYFGQNNTILLCAYADTRVQNPKIYRRKKMPRNFKAKQIDIFLNLLINKNELFRYSKKS